MAPAPFLLGRQRIPTDGFPSSCLSKQTGGRRCHDAMMLCALRVWPRHMMRTMRSPDAQISSTVDSVHVWLVGKCGKCVSYPSMNPYPSVFIRVHSCSWYSPSVVNRFHTNRTDAQAPSWHRMQAPMKPGFSQKHSVLAPFQLLVRYSNYGVII